MSHVALQDLEENRFQVAELYGKLANIFADLPNKRLQSSSMFKTLVSGDRITAERKHENPFVFRNHAKLIFSRTPSQAAMIARTPFTGAG